MYQKILLIAYILITGSRFNTVCNATNNSFLGNNYDIKYHKMFKKLKILCKQTSRKLFTTNTRLMSVCEKLEKIHTIKCP